MSDLKKYDIVRSYTPGKFGRVLLGPQNLDGQDVYTVLVDGGVEYHPSTTIELGPPEHGRYLGPTVEDVDRWFRVYEEQTALMEVEERRTIPEGAEIKPWGFFVDGGINFTQCKGWQVWVGGETWMDVQDLIYARDAETGYWVNLAQAPVGLMLIVRYVGEERP